MSKTPSSVADLRGLTLRDILIRPIITEKSMTQAQFNRYTFEVHKSANKTQIRDAIEKIFSVKVLKVTTNRTDGKLRRRGRHSGYTAEKKKATVTLKAGDQIEIAGTPLFEA